MMSRTYTRNCQIAQCAQSDSTATAVIFLEFINRRARGGKKTRNFYRNIKYCGPTFPAENSIRNEVAEKETRKTTLNDGNACVFIYMKKEKR